MVVTKTITVEEILEGNLTTGEDGKDYIDRRCFYGSDGKWHHF